MPTAIATTEEPRAIQTQDDWELESVKACRIDNPDCEACQ